VPNGPGVGGFPERSDRSRLGPGGNEVPLAILGESKSTFNIDLVEILEYGFSASGSEPCRSRSMIGYGSFVTSSRGAIENLIAEYAERIDSGDFEGVADLLADAEVGADMEDVAPAGGRGLKITGRDKVLRLYNATTRRFDDGTPKTRHVTTNLWIEVDEESGTAAARSSFAVLQAAPGLALQCILVGRYRDRFERHEGRWRFSERRFRTDLVGDLSHHLLDASALPDVQSTD